MLHGATVSCLEGCIAQHEEQVLSHAPQHSAPALCLMRRHQAAELHRRQSTGDVGLQCETALELDSNTSKSPETYLAVVVAAVVKGWRRGRVRRRRQPLVLGPVLMLVLLLVVRHESRCARRHAGGTVVLRVDLDPGRRVRNYALVRGVVFDLWRRLDGAAADRGAGLDDHFGGLLGGLSGGHFGEFLGLLLRMLHRLGLVLGLGGEQPAAAAAVVVRLDLRAMNAQAGQKSDSQVSLQPPDATRTATCLHLQT